MSSDKAYELSIDQNNVATITLNRPELHNAFNDQLINDLTLCFKKLEENSLLRAVVLTGNGKSFCAGADLNWMKSMKDYSFEENVLDAKKLRELFVVINQFTRPVIGKINGSALGGGAGLVAVCDYVIAVKSALFGFTETNLGLVPAVISPFVVAKIGEGHARARFISGSRFSTDAALTMGLIHEVCEDQSELNVKTLEVIKQFLKAGPIASVKAKELIYKLKLENNIEDYTTKLIATLRSSKEGQEGMSSLLDKKKVSWIKE